MATKVIRVKRKDVANRQEGRHAEAIRADGYLKTVSSETHKRFYINQNTGIML